ncbi:MAG: type II toxin-antitoxin system RelB/DinJ family antitoxin [Verrucomicrobia bacterium]|nr:type II toxin-antitoxin system RelB/DinJ family antitoxin [Verrucomicrobiota bacterium]
MSKTATIRAQIELGLKEEVDKILSDLGLTTTQTIQLLYNRIREDRRLPFPVETPNKLTARTLRESKVGRNVRRFASKQELYTDLGL